MAVLQLQTLQSYKYDAKLLKGHKRLSSHTPLVNIISTTYYLQFYCQLPFAHLLTLPFIHSSIHSTILKYLPPPVHFLFFITFMFLRSRLLSYSCTLMTYVNNTETKLYSCQITYLILFMEEIKQCANKLCYQQRLGYVWSCFTTSLNADTRITCVSVSNIGHLTL